ncbi:hypothetical protein B0A54_11246 [Friedmanniomyces endolithicus]|uniref:F-box domain-containing protein n=2 Tax=Dothideomycetidae TaxID=451867 RepID=A0A4U0UN50_9PEZI|nr:hypothetical protein LTS09_016302 [Friedmanniomyces endolithicus]TKA37261.1 hypothetical protein B0A54_11246 [Friedmanniomyces endolithicus]
MEAFPPSYEAATRVDYLDIIASYVPSNDLCSAALVCNGWHKTFAPHLWGAPASHFTQENDRVYVALTKFKRTLKTARLGVRSLTHTLHLPPAHAEIYNGPHADWLRDVLERLPNLQTLVVRGLPFFDHAALQALKYVKPKQEDYGPPANVIEVPGTSGYAFSNAAVGPSMYGLRLLDASRCTNVTANGLAHILSRFETLMYLDLSFTYPSRDTTVLKALRRLSGLQVLKLRGVSLSDDSLDALAPAIGSRVRSLDIRDNRITDRGVRLLLCHCFMIGELASTRARSPAMLPYLGAEMLDIYQGEDFEGYLRSAFSESFVSRLAIEDVPEGGITHLYISGNDLTVEGASGLVRSGRLHVLDIGDVSRGLAKHPSMLSGSDSDVVMPGVEKLTPILSKCASDALTFIRIDHNLVTKDAPTMHADEIIQGRVELPDNSTPIMPTNQSSVPITPTDAFELDATSSQANVFELADTSQIPLYEVAGDPMHIYVSSADDFVPDTSRRGSAFAPEVVPTTEKECSEMLSPVSVWEGSATDGSAHDMAESHHAVSPTTPRSPVRGNRPRTYSSVDAERHARLTAHTAGSHTLHPAMLPHLSTLILTNVPTHAAGKDITNRLIAFIKHCGEESRLAKIQATLDYAIPPGRKGHASALKHSANKIFALKRLVLEMDGTVKSSKNSKASPWQHSNTKSMTGDRDSEALWSAADTDFSFFGEGDECEFPSLEPRISAHGLEASEKEVRLGIESMVRPTPGASQPSEAIIDTVATLSAFRKERKLAFERGLAVGADYPETEGYWEGVVQVVRPGSALPDEELDYYGNTYSAGYLYR